MIQITQKQLENLAFRNNELKQEIQYCQREWIETNAGYIAGIETKRIDKTLYGDWPKGWKAQMFKESEQIAKKNLIDRFIQRNCRQIDGVTWLNNWDMIQEIEQTAKQ